MNLQSIIVELDRAYFPDPRNFALRTGQGMGRFIGAWHQSAEAFDKISHDIVRLQANNDYATSKSFLRKLGKHVEGCYKLCLNTAATWEKTRHVHQNQESGVWESIVSIFTGISEREKWVKASKAEIQAASKRDEKAFHHLDRERELLFTEADQIIGLNCESAKPPSIKHGSVKATKKQTVKNQPGRRAKPQE